MYGKAIGIFDTGGLILGEDNRKYKYKNSSIINVSKLFEDQNVQFVPRIDEAIEIVGAKKNIKKQISHPSKQTKDAYKAAPGAKMASFGVFLQFFLLIPVVGFILYLIGISVQLIGVKKLAIHKKNYMVYRHLSRGLFSGFIVIFITLGIIFYFGLDILELEVNNIPNILWILLCCILFISLYATIMVYKGLSALGKEYRSDILASTAWLHMIFLLLVPFGVGLIVFYVYIIILSIALFNLKIKK